MQCFPWLCLALLLFAPRAKAEAPEAWQLQVIATASELKDEPEREVERHFFWSNERRHDLFFPMLSARAGKGGHVGVGGDQNYTLAAAAEAKAMWLLDIDADVVRMHRLYAALLPMADTPEVFLQLLEAADQSKTVRQQVVTAYGATEGAKVFDLYQNHRQRLAKHLRKTAKLEKQGLPTTWMGNQKFYKHIQGLAKNGLIIARIGNLYGPKTLMGIGHAAEKSGVKITTVYFSNAEAWFQYNPVFRRNIATLPFDEQSVILRTIEAKTLVHPTDDFWHFCVQGATDFVTKIEKPSYRSTDRLMREAKTPTPPVQGLSYIGRPSH
jgi:hypothetical protein